MAATREKFSSQLDPELPLKARTTVHEQGRLFQSLLEDALSEYLELHQGQRPRQHVLDAFSLSLEEFDDLYKQLAK
jgi:hypothetical protein